MNQPSDVTGDGVRAPRPEEQTMNVDTTDLGASVQRACDEIDRLRAALREAQQENEHAPWKASYKAATARAEAAEQQLATTRESVDELNRALCEEIQGYAELADAIGPVDGVDDDARHAARIQKVQQLATTRAALAQIVEEMGAEYAEIERRRDERVESRTMYETLSQHFSSTLAILERYADRLAQLGEAQP